MDEGKEHVKPSPILRANLCSRLLYCWLNPLLSEGNRRTLQGDDIYSVLEEDSTQHLVNRLEVQWERELEQQQQQQQQDEGEEQLLHAAGTADGVKVKVSTKKKATAGPSLARALRRTFRSVWWKWFIIALLEETIKVSQAVLLGGLIQYFSRDSLVTKRDAYGYAAGIGALSILLALIRHPYAFAMFRLGVWLRLACCGLVYKKCLRLSNERLSKTTVGHIVNLMSNDVQRFDFSQVFAHYLILGPLEVISVFIILWFMINWSAITGMSLLVLLLPLLAVLSRCFANLRSKTAAFTDERVRLVNEMLTAMRLVKLYCWELLFDSRISSARREEFRRVKKASIARSMAFGPFFYSGKMIVSVSFLTYVLMGNTLNSHLVFVVISLYNVVRLTMTFYLPFGIQFGSEAKVTIERVQAFLLQDERVVSSSLSVSPAGPMNSDENGSTVVKASDAHVSMRNVTASWGGKGEQNGYAHGGTADGQSVAGGESVLRNIVADVGAGQLLAIIGPVGSGKTSLLMALLGELPLSNGSIEVKGRMAYVSQQAWVFSASVRQNIIFNSEFDVDRYNSAIHAAALKKDLELMPEGDRTLVGDRGVSLSGGQKARISLARAIYSNADIYLLDDPLSAVDTQVSKHIFNKCVCGVLKTKPRILVTHQLQYLKAADLILVLSKEEKPRLGTYEELCRGGLNIEQLLVKYQKEQEEQLFQKSATSPTAVKSQEPRIASPSKPKLNSKPVSGQNDDETEMLMLKQSESMKPAVSTLSITSFASTVVFDDAAEFRPEVANEESMVGGSVGVKLYLKYFYLGTGILGILLLIALNILSQLSYIVVDWWLAKWCNDIEAYEMQINRTYWLPNVTNLVEHGSTVLPVDTSTWIYESFPDNMRNLVIFTGLTAAVVIFSQLRATHTFYMLVKSADSLHKLMLSAVLRSPISFFDANPIGRILNRFSKDIGQIDEILPLFMYDFMQCLLLVLAVILVVGIVNPWVFIPTLPLCALFIYLRNYYLKSARTLKRLEATTKSPVFSHISATVLGLHTVRAYGAETVFIKEYCRHQDRNTAAFYLYLITGRWFAVRLELICAVFITMVSAASVLAANSLNSGLVGLSLNYAITMMALFQWAVRQSSEVESTMTSVERIVEYSKLSSEGNWFSKQSDKLKLDNWPSKGSITARDLCLRYSPDGPLVLKHLNFDIQPGEKIGIVGRTGAGKSSLISVLFRLIEPSGQLGIDNIDVLSIGLHELRDKISIIPQDPELFSGTVRKNLDPLGKKSDLQIWHALQQVQLKERVDDMGSGLDSEIHEGGRNISMGERQLFCMARAILKSNRIMIIDEATANVDTV